MGRRAVDIKEADPKGLVRESYNIEGITMGECRSIFIDWALSLPAVVDTPDCLRSLLAHYGLPNPAHPMTQVLTEALTAPANPTRRGGRAGRFANL
jgi:hypothetical protein